MLANQQMRLVNEGGKSYGHLTLNVKMAIINYILFDSLLPEVIPASEINYNVNFSNTVSIRVNLALCDGGANECIKGNDMRVLYYNGDGRRASIGIAGDHQLIGARLFTGVSIAKSNQG